MPIKSPAWTWWRSIRTKARCGRIIRWRCWKRSGLSDLNRETFSAFASYITSPEAQQAILAKGYRPADLNIKIDGANSPINANNGADPAKPQTSLQVPAAAVLDVVREGWLANKRRTNVMLVVDTSGSMEGEKIDNVKEALTTFLDQIKSDEERVGLIEFYSDVTERVKISELKNNRSDLVRAVTTLDAGGNTALLDGVAAAYERLQQLNDPSRINAIVVMTDGKENASAISLKSTGETPAERQSARRAGGDLCHCVRQRRRYEDTASDCPMRPTGRRWSDR